MDPLDRAAAIRATLADLVLGRDRVLELIREARDSADHEALGYPSWTAYVSGEFGELLPKLTRAERQPLVATLRSLGMSTRAIAPVVGASHMTVDRDLAAVTPVTAPQFPGSADGRSTSQGEVAPAPAEESGQTGGEVEPQADEPERGTGQPVPASPPPVTGVDGKTYTPRSHSPVIAEAESRKAAWQPFRSLMSSTVEQFIDGHQVLIDHHEWADLDQIHNRLGIDSREAVLTRLRALHAAAANVLEAWEDDNPTLLRRIK